MACNQKISEIHISRLEMNLMSSQIESKKLIVDWDLKLILSQVNNHPSEEIQHVLWKFMKGHTK